MATAEGWTFLKTMNAYRNNDSGAMIHKAEYDKRVSEGTIGSSTEGGTTATPIERAQAKSKEALNVEQGLNPDGTPIRPEYEGISEDGKLKEPYRLNVSQYVPTLEGKLDYQDLKLDKYDPSQAAKLQQMDPNSMESFDMLKQLATSQGPSKWAKAAEQQVQRQRETNIDASTRQSAGAYSQAYGQAAQRGVGTGAQANIAESLARDLFRSKQQSYRQAGDQNLAISKQDEEMRRQALGQFSGLEERMTTTNLGLTNEMAREQAKLSQSNVGIAQEEQRLNNQMANKSLLNEMNVRNQNLGNMAKAQSFEEQFNLANVLRDKNMGDSKSMEAYKARLDFLGAQQQASATAASGGGGGGCFITTAVCDSLGLDDDNPILNALRKLRDDHMGGKDNKLVKIYYKIAPTIVSRIKAKDPAQLISILKDWILPAFFAIKRGEHEEAVKIYKDLVECMGLEHLHKDEQIILEGV